jgi:release factor glutamine methyltransferase
MKLVSELITIGTKELPKHEIEYLLTGLLKKQCYEFYLYEQPVSDEVAKIFFDMMQKRKEGVPVQYLLHTATFLDFELYVDDRVFIPRPETEELVAKTINRLNSPSLIIEIGTGSGAIAIALAKTFPNTRIIATDISQSVLEVAKINVDRYDLGDRITLTHANLFNFSGLDSLHDQADCLISNPPYIDQVKIQFLPITVKDYEPRTSLDGGKKGFEIIQTIITEGMKFVKSAPGRLIALEIDPAQKDLISKIMPQADFEPDLSGNIRFAFLRPNQQ